MRIPGNTAPDHARLSAWGKPGRESIRLLCQLTDYDFQAGFAAMPRRDTVLGAIGQGLLTLEPPREAVLPLAQDTSFQLSTCPGIRREVETVYNSILYNMEADPDLRMTDIAVMVSDMSRYKPVIDAVFSRQPASIAYNLVDSNARTESVFAQAVLAVNAWSDVLVNADTAQRNSCYRRSGLWSAFERRATPAQLETAARYSPDFSLPDPLMDSDPTEAGLLTVNLLRHFLLDPVKLVGRYHLGVGEQTDPTAERAEMEDKPLASVFPIDFRLRTTPLAAGPTGRFDRWTPNSKAFMQTCPAKASFRPAPLP